LVYIIAFSFKLNIVKLPFGIAFLFAS